MNQLLMTLFLLTAQANQECESPIFEKLVFKKAQIKICEKKLDVEIADNDVLRSFGLMCRKNLPKNNGMLFVFEEEKKLSFWMKNTLIPLSIGYLNKEKELQEVLNMSPLDEKRVYESKGNALYALETNLGWFKKNGIKAGCKFVFVENSTGQQSPRP